MAWSLPRSVVVAAASSWYKGHRYPPEIIAHCVWLYHRFPLSFREVEELMRQRGVVVSDEPSGSGARSSGRSTPTGCAGAGPGPATRGISMKSSSKINGTIHFLWRAVDQHGNVLDVLVQSRRHALAAIKFVRRLLTGLR